MSLDRDTDAAFAARRAARRRIEPGDTVDFPGADGRTVPCEVMHVYADGRLDLKPPGGDTAPIWRHCLPSAVRALRKLVAPYSGPMAPGPPWPPGTRVRLKHEVATRINFEPDSGVLSRSGVVIGDDWDTRGGCKVRHDGTGTEPQRVFGWAWHELELASEPDTRSF